jgi:ABC-type glycerol-3-phosphate transport system substrate-binding protein
MRSRIPSPFSRFVLGVLAISLLGQGCTRGPDPAAVAASKPVTIKIWGVVDDEDAYDAVFNDYHAQHPFVSVEYRRFRLEEYENEILNALAEDRGPDIFLIHNTWVGKYLPKILPMPASTKVAVQTLQGTLRKEVVPVLQTEPTVSLRQFKTDYPDVAALDLIRTVNVSTNPEERDLQARVVAMPMSVDTLGMYVNKDLLNAAGIATIPETWDAFQDAVKRLTKQDSQGEIIQSGAALGTGANVERSPDILSVLMMQNGAEMSAPDGSPTFQTIPARLAGERDTPPSHQALGFYTDFANPAKEVYTWNVKQPNSLDAFIQGKSAFFFGYSYHLPTIKARAPKLNLAIARLPQIAGNPTVNFANYWAWTVSKKTKSTDVAWNLLNFMRKPEEIQKYLSVAKRPAALRPLLPGQLEDEEIGVFSSQVLTAQSWYRGNDPRAVDAAFVTLIEEALTTPLEDYGKIVNAAADKVSQTITFIF